jgi:hypothetical protein
VLVCLAGEYPVRGATTHKAGVEFLTRLDKEGVDSR